MLDRLARPRHVHRVGQVGPAQARVGGLVLQDLVGAVAHDAGDVVVLVGLMGGGWTGGGLSRDHVPCVTDAALDHAAAIAFCCCDPTPCRSPHLRRAAGGVHQAYRPRVADVARVEGADEELVVRAVDGVAALERQDVLRCGVGCWLVGWLIEWWFGERLRVATATLNMHPFPPISPHLVGGQRRADLGRGGAGEDAGRQGQALDLAAWGNEGEGWVG